MKNSWRNSGVTKKTTGFCIGSMKYNRSLSVGLKILGTLLFRRSKTGVKIRFGCIKVFAFAQNSAK